MPFWVPISDLKGHLDNPHNFAKQNGSRLRIRSLRSLDKIQRFCILSMKASLSLEQQPQLPTFGDIILEVFKCPFGFRFRTQKGTWTTHITSSKNGSRLKIRSLRSLDKIQRFCILSMKASLSLEQQPQMLTFGDIILGVFKCPFGFRFRIQKGTWTTHVNGLSTTPKQCLDSRSTNPPGNPLDSPQDI